MLNNLQKNLSFDVAVGKKNDWTQKAILYCKKNGIHLETIDTQRTKTPAPVCLGGGGISAVTFRIFNNQGPSVLKIYRLPKTSPFTIDNEYYFRKPFASTFQNILVPYRFDQEGDYLFVQRRYIPLSLPQRLRFPTSLSFHLFCLHFFEPLLGHTPHSWR